MTPGQMSLFGPCHREHVDDARARVLERRFDKGGCRCPCCGALCRVSVRSHNASMARALLWLVAQGGGDRRGWVPVTQEAPSWVHRSREFPKNQYWALIQPKVGSRGDRRKSALGVWRATPRGVAFARRQLYVPRQAIIYRKRVLRYSDEQTDVVGSLGRKFDYWEVVAGLGGLGGLGDGLAEGA